MRSRTGCLTCRTRKLKCDEGKPTCGQCIKANRECVPSPGVVFRHQQNASMNGEEGGVGGSLGRFFGYKETFDKKNTWVKIPAQVTFVHITDPYQDDPSPDQSSLDAAGSSSYIKHGSHQRDSYSGYDDQSATHGLEALSAAASGERYSYAAQAHHRTSSQPYPQIDSYPQPSQSSPVQALKYILNQASPESSTSAIDPRLHESLSSGVSPSDSITALRRVSSGELPGDEDIPFLLRHFSEGPGHWMDLFDLGGFFEMDVPVRAKSSPLLLNSAVALSAKALARGTSTGRGIKAAAPKYTEAQWYHKARTYYDQAICLMRQTLAAETGGFSPVMSDSATSGSSGWRKADSEDLTGTIAILCVYEFLDASGAEWSRHLDGAKSLFEIAKDGVVSMPPGASWASRSSGFKRSPRQTRAAVFWNFARQDMLHAFINNIPTRLDTTDLDMWAFMGLRLDEEGYVLPSNEALRHEPMGDDMVGNALVWLVMKLVNYIIEIDEVPEDRCPIRSARRQKQLLDFHDNFDFQLTTWYNGLPDGFTPTATSRADGTKYTRPGELVRTPMHWYARPLCASTMQWYHFCRIQLLHIKHQITNGIRRMMPGLLPQLSLDREKEQDNSYMAVLKESLPHAREIMSIGLAVSDDSARIHSVQPIFIASQVLGNPMSHDKNTIGDLDGLRACAIGILRELETDVGWATEYRETLLLQLWGLPTDWRRDEES